VDLDIVDLIRVVIWEKLEIFFVDQFGFCSMLEAFRCGMWGDVSNCRVAFAHGVSVLDLPGLHGWHLNAQQPPEEDMADMADIVTC